MARVEKRLIFLLMILFINSLFSTMIWAQKSGPFKSGEQLDYEILYKYGFVMVRAGSAHHQVSAYTYNNKPVFKSSLDFRTSSFFDKIFKIRDSLSTYVSLDYQPLYHSRFVNEGNTSFSEYLYFISQSPSLTEVRVKRESKNVVKFDTLMRSENQGYDILSIFTFARILDYTKIQVDQAFPLTSFVGKRKVNILVRYKGQSIFEKSETLKYKALRFEVDIVDEVFTGEKNAMEIWISDDENHIPLKLKAKLKIGAAEAVLSSYKNLKYPFTSEIKIKPK